MKTRAALSLIVSTLMVIPVFSATAAINESALKSVCSYVAQDDKSRLRKALKSSGLRLRKHYDKFGCNGQSLLRFAMSSGANEAGEYLAKQLSKDQLDTAEADGQTILQWAVANGKGDTATVAAIKKRIN